MSTTLPLLYLRLQKDVMSGAIRYLLAAAILLVMAGVTINLVFRNDLFSPPSTLPAAVRIPDEVRSEGFRCGGIENQQCPDSMWCDYTQHDGCPPLSAYGICRSVVMSHSCVGSSWLPPPTRLPLPPEFDHIGMKACGCDGRIYRATCGNLPHVNVQFRFVQHEDQMLRVEFWQPLRPVQCKAVGAYAR